MTIRRGDEAVVEALRGEGVKYIFGLPGGHSMRILYDALYDARDIESILFRHEEAAAFAAFGYAWITGEVGVAHGTAGPGWSQMLSGVYEAWQAKLPYMALVGLTSTSRTGMGLLQEAPQQEISAQAAKWSYVVPNPERIPWAIRRGFSVARSDPPGPVYIHIPDNLGMSTKIDMPPYRPGPARIRTAADPQVLAEAAEKILKAKAPIIIAGRGVHASAAWQELRRFAELLAIPVLTTESGKSAIAENHPLSAGGVGINFTKVSHKVFKRSDCMVWIGSRLDEISTSRWPDLPGKTFIHIDVDPGEFAHNWIPDVAVAGDARLVLQQLYDYCAPRVQIPNWKDYPRVRDLQESWQRYQRELDAWLVNYDAPVHPLEVIYAIQKTMDTDAIVLAGEGANRIWTTSYLRMPTENSWVISSNFACMGLATAGAFGVKAGCPDRQVICVTGDGAFQMQLQELPVAIQHKLPITWVVLNNNCLGWIKWRQEVVTDSRIIDVDFRPNWDFVKAAEAAGCFGVRVDRKADLQGALQQAFERNRRGQAAVVEVMTLELEMAPGFLAHMGYGEPFTD